MNLIDTQNPARPSFGWLRRAWASLQPTLRTPEDLIAAAARRETARAAVDRLLR
ncbi:MAG: hypothetical protein AAF914_11075 [Pseudomonadota bacterium]